MKQKFLSLLLVSAIFFVGFLPTASVSAADVGFGFVKQFSGTSSENPEAVKLDASGNIYTAGYFQGTVDFDPGSGTANLASAGSYDAFVSKLDSSGNYVWAKKIGSTTGDFASSVAIDSSGNVYLFGQFSGTVDFDPGAGTSNLVSAGDADAFILKLDSDGNFVFAKKFGSTAYDNAASMTIDSSANIFMTGLFNGTVDFDPGAGTANIASGGGQDVYILKLDSSGTYVWSKAVGGAGSEYSSGIALDGSGNVLVHGAFSATTDFDPGAGTTNLTSVGGQDGFILKLSSLGALTWVKQLNGYVYAEAIAIDSNNNVYTTGYFFGTMDADPSGSTANLVGPGGFEIYVSKLDSSGNYSWGKMFASSDYDSSFAIAIDSSNNVYTTGYFEGTIDFDPGSGTANLTSPGSSDDTFISALDSSGNYLWAKQFGSTDAESGYGITVDSSGNVFSVGTFGGTVDFDPGSGTSNLTDTGSGDIYISKLIPLTAPSVSVSAASNVTLTTAIINGSITDTGGESNTSRGFQYGVTNGYGTTLTQTGTYSSGTFNANLTDLSCSTTYYYRAFSTNSVSTSYSTGTSFSTTACPAAAVFLPGALNNTGSSNGGDSSNIPPITPISPIQPITPPTTPTQETQYPTNTFTNQQTGKSVKVSNLPAVYYITLTNKKLIYPNWNSFLSYNKTTSDIQTITKTELDSYPTIQYIKSDPNGIVYKLTNLTKQALTQAACDRLKVTADDVLLISQIQMDNYKRGANILK